MAPRVSIVVPARDEARHIERCVRSVLAQEVEGGVEMLLKGIDWDSRSQGLGVNQYSRRGNGWRGLIISIGNYVIHVEAADDAAVEARLRSLPFVAPNPKPNWLWLLFSKHATAAGVGLAIYLLLYAVAMFRGGAWAARVSPQPGDRGHDTWAAARTQHGPVSTARSPSVWPVSPPLDRPASPRERHGHRGSAAAGPRRAARGARGLPSLSRVVCGAGLMHAPACGGLAADGDRANAVADS